MKNLFRVLIWLIKTHKKSYNFSTLKILTLLQHFKIFRFFIITCIFYLIQTQYEVSSVAYLLSGNLTTWTLLAVNWSRSRHMMKGLFLDYYAGHRRTPFYDNLMNFRPVFSMKSVQFVSLLQVFSSLHIDAFLKNIVQWI